MSKERTITERELLENLGWIRALAQRLAHGDAEDLVQQVCLAALDGGRIRQPASLSAAGPRVRAWLSRATHYLANNQRRAGFRREDRERSQARPEAQPSAHDVVARHGLLVEVGHAVGCLAEPYRTAVLLRYLDGLPTPAIAAQTQVSESVVRKRLSRGLSKLRDQLGSRGFDGRALAALFPIPTTAIAAPAAASSSIGVISMGTTLTKVVASVTVAAVATVVLVQDEEPSVALPETVAHVAGKQVTDFDLPSTEPKVGSSTPRPEPSAAESGVEQTTDAREMQRREVSSPPLRSGQVDQEAVALEQKMAMEESFRNMTVALDKLMAEQDRLQRNRPEDGYLIEAYEDGSRKAAGMIVEGHKDGEWTQWHASGAEEARGTYFASIRHGFWTFWSDEGIELKRADYFYGEEEGTVESLEGDNRQLIDYRNGKQHGSHTTTNLEGQVLLRQEWYQGRQHGLSTSYHPNGLTANEGRYEHGYKVGPWKHWLPNGDLDPTLSKNYDLEEQRDELDMNFQEVKAFLDSSTKR